MDMEKLGKVPSVDRKVEWDLESKEVRFPIILTLHAKEIAHHIVLLFKQHICGFVLLCVQDGMSCVCNMNWIVFTKPVLI